ncbi:hypothetical protein ACHQM5_013872 [Ranunculus cassubicifolius]
MAALARKLITKSQLFSFTLSRRLNEAPINSARRCLNLHHRCLLSTINNTNSAPVHSDSTLNHSTPDLQTPNRTRSLHKEFTEQFTKQYGHHQKYWKVYILPDLHMAPVAFGMNTDLTRDQIINEYIKILATALNSSEEEAKKKIYSVSTRHVYFFVCEISLETAVLIQDGPGPILVVEPISESDLKRDDYAETGEPFIDGKAVEYDQIYHKAILKNMYASSYHRRKSGVEFENAKARREEIIRSGGFVSVPAKEKMIA